MKNIESLTQKQINLLARTALLVISKKSPDFSMKYFCRSKDNFDINANQVKKKVNECGASCCLMGLAAYLDQDSKRHETWAEFGLRALGATNSSGEYGKNGAFMFDADWPDNRKQAASRILVWLRGEDCDIFDLDLKYSEKEGRLVIKEKFLADYSLGDLRKELKKYIKE